MKTDARRASRIFEGVVRNGRGEHLGRIEDLVLDLEDGRIEYALLTLDEHEMAGVRRVVTVPWSSLHRQDDGRAFLLEVSKRTLLAVSMNVHD
ncbi:MAG: PRC-barrel domain-containing protein [Gammaproteobacteria bacterium]